MWGAGAGVLHSGATRVPLHPQLTAGPSCKEGTVRARHPLGLLDRTGLCSLALYCGPHIEGPGALRIQGRAPQLVRGFCVQEGSISLQRSPWSRSCPATDRNRSDPLRYGGQFRLHIPKLQVGCRGGSPEMKGDVTNRHKPKPSECPLPGSECPQS